MGTLVITQEEIKQLLSLSDYIPIIENVHTLHADGQVYEPDLLHANVVKGEFHLKTGGLIHQGKEYFGVKINGGFFNNTKEYNLPNILGIIYICDARNGYPLAMMDSVIISRYRTAAATAVAAKYLAPQQPIRLGIFGYGAQAEIQTKAILHVCNVKEIRISGRDLNKASVFAEKLKQEIDLPIICDNLENTAGKSNFLVTTTPSRLFYLRKEWITPGTFIAAIGADSPGKQELEPALLASATIIADIKTQVCRVGESQHAIRQHLITPDDIYAELGEIITGKKKRPEGNAITIYDSTGTALQDIGVGIHIYQKLQSSGHQRIKLFP